MTDADKVRALVGQHALIRSCAANALGSAITRVPDDATILKVTAEVDGASGGIIGTVTYERDDQPYTIVATVRGFANAVVTYHGV